MLIEIKRYLVGRGPVSLTEIACKLAADPDALRPMLKLWIGKGKIRRVKLAGRCHGCTSCAPQDLEFYQWAGESSDGSSRRQGPRRAAGAECGR